MEKLNINQKIPKKSKTNKKPIRIIYFSNPRKVRASPAEFRAIVQELTGQDSIVPDFPSIETPESASANDLLFIPPNHDTDRSIHRCDDVWKSDAMPLDMFHDVFSTTLMENSTGLLTQPSVYCDPRGDRGF